jgi:hypothetical protein
MPIAKVPSISKLLRLLILLGLSSHVFAGEPNKIRNKDMYRYAMKSNASTLTVVFAGEDDSSSDLYDETVMDEIFGYPGIDPNVAPLVLITDASLFQNQHNQTRLSGGATALLREMIDRDMGRLIKLAKNSRNGEARASLVQAHLIYLRKKGSNRSVVRQWQGLSDQQQTRGLADLLSRFDQLDVSNPFASIASLTQLDQIQNIKLVLSDGALSSYAHFAHALNWIKNSIGNKSLEIVLVTDSQHIPLNKRIASVAATYISEFARDQLPGIRHRYPDHTVRLYDAANGLWQLNTSRDFLSFQEAEFKNRLLSIHASHAPKEIVDRVRRTLLDADSDLTHFIQKAFSHSEFSLQYANLITSDELLRRTLGTIDYEDLSDEFIANFLAAISHALPEMEVEIISHNLERMKIIKDHLELKLKEKVDMDLRRIDSYYRSACSEILGK